MLDLTDNGYRKWIGDLAYDLAGQGFSDSDIHDLRAKFLLFRTVARLLAPDWPDRQFAALIFGEQPDISSATSSPAPGNFSKKLAGTVAVSARDAATMTQMMNFFIHRAASDKRTRRTDGRPKTGSEIMADAVGFMSTMAPGETGLKARDLKLPMLEFAARLAAAAAHEMLASDDAPPRTAVLDGLHDLTMDYLLGLRRMSFARSAVRIVTDDTPRRSLTRFGSAQEPSAEKAWDMRPEPFDFRNASPPPAILRLDHVSEVRCELRAVTVRNARHGSTSDRDGLYCWEETWENLVRWSRPVFFEPGQSLQIDYGTIVEKSGEYSVFVLNDVGATGQLAELLASETEEVPIEGFHRLLPIAADARKHADAGFECYVRRYRVKMK